jgi:hypothetical protein
MLGSIQGLGKWGHGIFYAVPATYLYLIATEAAFPIPYFRTYDPRLAPVILLAFSLYAALWLHHVTLLIFGKEAGLESSLKSEVSRQHLTYFATGVPPKELPDTSSPFKLMLTATASDNLQWQPFLRYAPAGFYYFYSLIGWLWLTFLFLADENTLVAGGLWLILSIFIFKNRVSNYLPDYIPPESAEDFDEPEYITTYRRITQSDNEPESTQRIKKSQSVDQDYRTR